MALAQSQFSAAYSQMFADLFLQKYQANGKLRGTVRELHGLVGDAYKLKYMDKGSMVQHTANGSNIPAGSTTVTAPSITFSDFEMKDVVDRFDQLNFNASALPGLAEKHAKAIARREDQFIIDACINSGTTKTVAAGGENMTVEKLRDARRQLGLDEIDDDMFLLMHWNNLDSLLAQTEYTSSIFNDAKPLVDPGGKDGPFAGFKIIPLGNRSGEGGLPIDGSNIRSCFVYARSAITMGYRLDAETQMVPVPQNLRTEVVSALSAGAVTGDANGVVKISCDES